MQTIKIVTGGNFFHEKYFRPICSPKCHRYSNKNVNKELFCLKFMFNLDSQIAKRNQFNKDWHIVNK